ncbi:MAG: hypothetical protein KAV42_08395 [Candidatus Krumholzibacteria bacterium]|nr:hypothetical protein [Candidatus Krumholzibacteria bacterium]
MTKKKYDVSDHGKNHELTLEIDAEKKTVKSGAVYNFGDNSSLTLDLAPGKLNGTFVHAGEEHSLKLVLDSSGKYSGTFRDSSRESLELEIQAGVVRIAAGKFPPEGKLKLKGKTHQLELRLDKKGRLSGKIKSRLNRSAVFVLDIRNNRISGQLTHKGKKHQTILELSNRGWKGKLTFKKGKSNISLNITGGKDMRLSTAKINALIKF